MTTGFIDDDRFLAHDTGDWHPERPERITAVRAALAGQAWTAPLLRLTPVPADLAIIENTHKLDYIRRAARSSMSARRRGTSRAKSFAFSPCMPGVARLTTSVKPMP